MKRALIGYSGFVGGNLLNQAEFSHRYRSTNIETIANENFDLVVCAGAPAAKWKANQEPDADRAGIVRLTNALKSMRTQRLILISTIDVFGKPDGIDEETAIDLDAATPYGKHRYELERFAVEHFDTLIVRLPGLFGPGLKKNVIYDFLHNNLLDRISSTAVFQFYDLGDLWNDITIAERAGLDLVHFATEPTSVAEVVKWGFGIEFNHVPDGYVPVRYDFRSRHAALFGGRDGYLRSRTQVLDAIQNFVAKERERISQEKEAQCA